MKNRADHGFTLIEIIIVIVLLGIISISAINILSPMFRGYVQSKETDLLFSEAKFTVGKIAKELRQAIPNSINLPDSTSIQFVIFDYSGFYSDNISGQNKMEVDTTAINVLAVDDLISIYNTKYQQIFPEDSNIEQRVYKIDSVDTANKYVEFDKDIEEDSPYYRYFRISTPITYYLKNNVIYRAFGYNLDDYDKVINGTASPLFTNVLAKNITNISFEYKPATLERNSMVTIKAVFRKDNTELTYSENVHIRNLP
jgi:MSHA biogenesis protein MshO